MKNLAMICQVVCYAVSSASLLVLNKLAISAFSSACLLLLVQLLSTALFILGLAALRIIKVVLWPGYRTLKAYGFVAAVFLLTIYSNVRVIQATGVNFFIVLRCATPLLISILDWLLLGRELPTKSSLLPLFGIFVSGSSYAFLKLNEQKDDGTSFFTAVGMQWSTVWLCSFVCDMIYIKYVVHEYPCSGFERTLYQNALAVPILSLFSVLDLGSTDSLLTSSVADIVILSLSCLAGTVLSYTGMSLRSELSATSFTVLGITCKMASAGLNEALVEPEESKYALVCIAAVILCSAFYRQAPMRSKLGVRPVSVQKVQKSKPKILSTVLKTFLVPMVVAIAFVLFPGRFEQNFAIGALHRIPTIIRGSADDAQEEAFSGSAREFNFPQHHLWGVTTTILEVNPAVVQFVEHFETNLVVVGDMKTNHSLWKDFESNHVNVVYLSPGDQTSLGYEISKYIPWNHFGRKSIGFLFAIKSGAQTIYDFDDDNHLSISADFSILNSFDITTISSDHHVFNPYPFFEATHSGKDAFVWPRGFPLGFIRDTEAYDSSHVHQIKNVSLENIAVFQSLADHDPDVDAIYRLSRPLPVYFEKAKTLLLPPRGTFIPWNAQAVLMKKPSFFGLLLPVTVTGRVSDIWRSYFTSRLIWETDFRISFTSPLVRQYRNPHSYMTDLDDEKDLYFMVDDLLQLLLEWTSDSFVSLEEAYLDIIEKAVEAGFLKMTDLNLARAWCKDLRDIQYQWPSVSSRMPSKLPRTPSIVDERNLDRPPPRKKNAVCLIGESFPKVFPALKRNVLQQMEADLFLVLKEGSSIPQDVEVRNFTMSSDSLEEFLDANAPNWTLSAPGNHLGGVPGHMSGHGAYQLQDRWMCEQLIVESEKESNHAYQNIGIGRADLLWLLPHPRVNTTGCWIPCQKNDFGGICDQWAWCTRFSASSYLTDPTVDLPILAATPINTETHLKLSLVRHDIHLDRGEAAFVRLCTEPGPSCTALFSDKNKNITYHAKISGEQIEEARNQLLQSIID